MEMVTPSGENPPIVGAIEAQIRDERLFSFDDKALRHAFIRKVFLILCSQLVLACLIIAPMVVHEPIRKVINDDKGIFVSAAVIFWALYTSILCCIGISRSWPQNYIVLLLMTIAASIATGCVCARYDYKEILIAAGGCAVICFVITVFASQTRFDVTALSGSLLILLIALTMLFILQTIAPSSTVHWVFLILGVTVLSMYFMVDVQVMVRGKHRYSLTPDDYIVATTLLFVDILFIFLFLVLMVRK